MSKLPDGAEAVVADVVNDVGGATDSLQLPKDEKGSCNIDWNLKVYVTVASVILVLQNVSIEIRIYIAGVVPFGVLKLVTEMSEGQLLCRSQPGDECLPVTWAATAENAAITGLATVVVTP